jgi:hypothetical protein
MSKNGMDGRRRAQSGRFGRASAAMGEFMFERIFSGNVGREPARTGIIGRSRAAVFLVQNMFKAASRYSLYVLYLRTLGLIARG